MLNLLFSHLPLCAACIDDLAGEAASVRNATIKVLSMVASSVNECGRQVTEERTFVSTGRLASMERPIRSATYFLLACRRLDDSPAEADAVLSKLAAASGISNLEMFIAANAENLAQKISAVRESPVISTSLFMPNIRIIYTGSLLFHGIA